LTALEELFGTPFTLPLTFTAGLGPAQGSFAWTSLLAAPKSM